MKKISRRGFTRSLALGGLGTAIQANALGTSYPELAAVSSEPSLAQWQLYLPGIWRMRLDTPEAASPVALRTSAPAREALRRMPAVDSYPLPMVRGKASLRGYELELPLASGELIYGLGLQMYSVMHRGSKKTLRVNADPKGDTGDAHAPVPFYVSTRGYGVFIDTCRYASVFAGSTSPHLEHKTGRAPPVSTEAPPKERFSEEAKVHVEIPVARGVDVYLFAGPTMLDAVARYNLFSGGGVNPPEWGLGFWYRAHAKSDTAGIHSLALEFRERGIPCDVIGLEPGWQTHAYSCSFVWNPVNFPDPRTMIAKLKAMNYRVNLWEHVYTHPTAPIYKELEPYAGDYDVFGGLAPDLSTTAARSIFGEYHRKALIDLGVSGFKLDECDNSDFTGGWSFPEHSIFPSGLDGEQMHTVLGLRYQDTIREAFERSQQQTFGLVRSSGSLAASSPFVLYSDLYDHRVFVRALVNSGFSGLLFCPEVRDAKNEEDLIRRMQTAAFSPIAMVNCWYQQYPPWKQLHASWETSAEREKNPGLLDEGWEKVEAKCRDILRLRMQLIPYLRASFFAYAESGVPPFRALVLDDPEDTRLALIDDAFLVGDRLLVAPVFEGQTIREVALPKGAWCDFWTGQPIEGGRTVRVPTSLDRIPVYVKAGSVLPMAEPGLHSLAEESRRLTVRIYGDGSLPFRMGSQTVFSWNSREDKGHVTMDPDNESRYEVVGWKRMTHAESSSQSL